MSTKIISTKLLLVEGKDECNFFEAFLRHCQMDGVQIIDAGGKDKFPYVFPAYFGAENFRNVTRLGFVRDAEANMAKSAFDSICGVLRAQRMHHPTAPAVVDKSTPVFTGVFIMPDNHGEGMLEHLCLQTISGTALYSSATAFIESISDKIFTDEQDKFNVPKATVQTYLAVRAPIVNSLGLGAKSGFWDFNNSCLDELKTFLSDLFS